MNRYTLTTLAALIAAGLGTVAHGAAPTPVSGTYTSESANGTIEIGNVLPDGTPVAEPVASEAPAAAEGPQGPHAKRLPAPVADAPTRALFEAYRDKMVQGDERTTASNPAVNRRYKMMDRDTYRATVLGIPPDAPKSAQ